MPVKHDLYADLSHTRDEVQKLRASDPHLHALLDKYSDIDTQVLQSEAAIEADDKLTRLKTERLSIKDKIRDRLNGAGKA
jgi:uncharacterized protein YdcH (DUF465 family)